MPKMNFSEHVMSVFSNAGVNYENLHNLMFDLATHKEIVDNGVIIPESVANAKVLNISRQIFQIDEHSDARARKRAYRDHAREFFDVIEEVIDDVVTLGFNESDWFNLLVDARNVKLGDSIQFYLDQEALFAVAKAGTSHHDHILQTMYPSAPITIPATRYVVAIGADIDRYLLGYVDWAKMVEGVSKSFVNMVQEEVYTTLTTATSLLPVTAGFVGTGTIVKANFDAIIENVSAANGGVDVSIVGTKTALKNLNALCDVDWLSNNMKDEFNMDGRIGRYEGTILVELPQRFKDKTYSAKIFGNNIIQVLPNIDDKFIKLVDYGDTEISEVTDKGKKAGRIDDIKEYEVQRTLGIGVALSHQFGQWTI